MSTSLHHVLSLIRYSTSGVPVYKTTSEGHKAMALIFDLTLLPGCITAGTFAEQSEPHAYPSFCAMYGSQGMLSRCNWYLRSSLSHLTTIQTSCGRQFKISCHSWTAASVELLHQNIPLLIHGLVLCLLNSSQVTYHFHYRFSDLPLKLSVLHARWSLPKLLLILKSK